MGCALAVDPLPASSAVVQFGGDPRRAQGVVLVVDPTDPFGQLGVCERPLLSARLARQPGVERGPGDLHDLAQPLHLEGVPVISDELETAVRLESSWPGAGWQGRRRDLRFGRGSWKR